MGKSVKIFLTPDELAESLASDLAEKINAAASRKSSFMVAVSGGNTPKDLFSLLGNKFTTAINWNYVHIFWVDERCVPPDDPESNYGMTKKTLLGNINIPSSNVHRMKGEEDPDKEALFYSLEIYKTVPERDGLPCFDLIMLGLGDDGHTASIFPGNEHLFSSDRICVSAVHPQTGQQRLTITGKVINNAAEVLFLVTGPDKAGVVKKVAGGRSRTRHLPASYVVPTNGKLLWYLDKNAASLLGKEMTE
ncbi:MAG: 6-phosphogluconolactonase [Bacteroidales bacterium]